MAPISETQQLQLRERPVQALLRISEANAAVRGLFLVSRAIRWAELLLLLVVVVEEHRGHV